MRARALALVGGLLVAGALPAVAQEGLQPRSAHQGFWVGFGLGGGSNLSDAASGARFGVGAHVRLGGTLSERLLLGGELIGWGRKISGSTITQSNAMVVALLYPSAAGVFLKGGIGFAGWTQGATSGNTTTTTTAGGFGLGAGLGYDVQVGSNLFLTPAVDFLYQSVESNVFQNSTGSLLMFTLGLTWH
jgi:Outer membrane protein beta-barrel domain